MFRPLITIFIVLFLIFSNLLQGQDCDAIEVDFARLRQVGDSNYLSSLLKKSDEVDVLCQLQKITNTYYSQFDYKQALLFGQALERQYQINSPGDSSLILRNWEVLSNSYHEMGLPDSVLVYGKKLLFALDRRIDESPENLSRILEIVAMSFIDKLQYDLAMEWVDLIGYHLLLEGMEESELFAGMLYVKGVVRTMQGEIEIAANLMDSIQNWKGIYTSSYPKPLARAHTLQIRLNLFLGNQDGIEYHLEKAQNVLNSNLPIDTATYISFLLNKSYYHLIMEEGDKEQKATQKAVEISEEFKAIPVLRSKVLLFHGMNFVDKNELKLAALKGEHALNHLSSKTFLNSSFSEFKGNLIEFLLIQLHNQQLRDSTVNFSEKIWEYNNFALNNLRSKMHSGNENLSDLKISKEDVLAFSEKILFLWDYYESRNGNIPFETIFNFFENYKSYIFNYYNHRNRIYFDKIDEINILNNESELRKEIIDLAKKRTRIKNNSINQYTYYKKILGKRVTYDQISNKVKVKHKSLTKEITSSNSISYSEVQNITKKHNETFISYISYRNYLFSMVISPSEMSLNKITIDSTLSLDSQITQLNNFHSSPDSMDYEVYSKLNLNLYLNLIHPLKEKLTENVVIIPHAKIFEIPFSALISKEPLNHSNFSTYDWLLTKYNFSYSPSISSYILNSQKQKTTSSPKILAVAPEFKTSKNTSLIRNDLSKLRFNIEEVQTIKKEVNTTLLTANNSTKENIHKHLKKSNILHFATHTITSKTSNNKTDLVLSTGISDSFELVNVNDIFPLNNSTNLVVLSACNTGKGKLIRGEGKLALANSFFNNGASVVISNLWDASDYSMKEIFSQFYKEVKSGNQISSSLRSAQINFLKTMPNELKHPFYWSGLTAMGNANTNFKKKNYFVYLISALSFLTLLLILLKLKY